MDLSGLSFLCLACLSPLLVGSVAPLHPQAQARRDCCHGLCSQLPGSTLDANSSLGGHSGENVTVGKGHGIP